MYWKRAAPCEPQLTGTVETRAVDFSTGYGSLVALRIPHLEARGRIIGVIGHNGSGKSTLLKSTLELLTPRSGFLQTRWVTEDGNKTTLRPEQHMAFSPEHGAVFEDISVESYLKLWCRIKHGRANYYRKEGSHYVELLDIAPLLDRCGHELSKGQRRRVQTAVGFITNPKLFLFDEPFDGLDVRQASHLAGIMTEQSQYMAMVVSSHRMDVVERLADLIVVLRNGAVLTSGNVEAVCRDLCEESILITQTEGDRERLHEVADGLRGAFSDLVINRVGQEIAVTGKGVSKERLSSFLESARVPNVRLSTARPNLTDAMSYHLKHLS